MTTKTRPTGETVEQSITQQAHDARYDSATLLSLLSKPEATVEDCEYITSLFLNREDSHRTDSMAGRIKTMSGVGESLIATALRTYDTGKVVDSKGAPVVLSSDDRTNMTMANLRRGLGLSERTDKHAFGDREVAYTDIQRYWQAQRASSEDVERGLAIAAAEGFADNVAKTIAAVASETFRRTDATEWQKKRTATEEAKAKRAEAKREAEEEAKQFAAVSAEVSPITVDEAWSLDQLRAIVVQVNARIVVVKEEAKKIAAEAKQAEQAEQAYAASLGKTVEEVRAMVAAFAAQSEQAETSAT